MVLSEHILSVLRAKNVPSHVQIELTKRCNWRCKFCYAECDEDDGLDTATLFTLLDDLKRIGTIEINFTGGEPLLKRRCIEIFERAKSLGFGLSLNTNGSLINEKNYRQLSELFSRIEISLHSGIESEHDQIVQRTGAWKKTVDAIKLLTEANVKVLMKCVLTQETLNSLNSLNLLSKSLGVELVVDYNITSTYSGNTKPLQYKLTNEQISKLIETDKSVVYKVSDDYIEENYKKRKLSDGICRAGRTSAFIDAEGNVFPCIIFKDTSVPENSGGYTENIKTKPFENIWRDNSLFHEIRALSAADFDKCLSCEIDNYCIKCIAKNYKASGDLSKPQKDFCIQAHSTYGCLAERKY
ncbi:radical SAM protein [Paenibacillus sp. FSL H8-0332]|uniref:radical SAM/SPASM domain-containing protein n=1 Tax=Paenibacillus sp. FSL H8-0332 TaxID=2954742 RepID=UPI0030D56CED